MNPEPGSQRQPALPTPRPAPMRAVHGIGVAASALVMIAAVVRAVAVHNSGWTQFATADLIVNGSVGLSGYATGISAIQSSIIWLGVAVVPMLVAAVVFLVWLYRARVNAEAMSPVKHRLARGWTVGAWFVPIANLVLPPLVVTDVWRASAGVRRASGALVSAWWAAVVLAWAIDVFAVVARSQHDGDQSLVSAYRTAATLHTVEALVTVAAAGLLVLIITRISRWQREALVQRYA